MDEQGPLRQAAALGALIAGIGVALGAFGTHSLRSRLSADDLAIWGTGVQYGTLHGVAIVALCAAGAAFGARTRGPALAMAAGAVVFQLSLYGLALGGPRLLGAIAPIGGLLMISGWLAAAWALRSVAERAAGGPASAGRGTGGDADRV